MAATSLLNAVAVAQRFGMGATAVTALAGVDLAITEGSFVCIVGPSGCGKSSLLNMMAGLSVPVRGEILFDGARLGGPTTQIGYITQKDNLLPWRTARENVALYFDIAGTDAATAHARVDAALDTVGLRDFAGYYPHQLSGGMRKRVTLARTLVYEPRVILADEPFGALDAQMRLIMQKELLRIWSVGGCRTIVFVTHDLEEAITLGDRVVVMSARPGRILEDITIDVARPRDPVRVRTTPRFGEIHEALWEILRKEVAG